MKTLSHIANELMAANQGLELAQGELDEMLEKHLMQLEKDLVTKTDSYVFMMEHLENSQEFWEKKSKEARAVAVGIAAHVQAMKDRIKQVMIQLDKKQILGETHKLTIRPTPKAKVIIADEEKVPVRFKTIVQTTTIDKDFIRGELEKGIEVRGATLERSVTLNIGINK